MKLNKDIVLERSYASVSNKSEEGAIEYRPAFGTILSKCIYDILEAARLYNRKYYFEFNGRKVVADVSDTYDSLHKQYMEKCRD